MAGGAGNHVGLCGGRGGQVPSENSGCATPSMDTPAPRHEEGLRRRGRSEWTDKWGCLFNWQGKVHPGPREGREAGRRCGKGMVFASTESHHQ